MRYRLGVLVAAAAVVVTAALAAATRVYSTPADFTIPVSLTLLPLRTARFTYLHCSM